MTKNLGTAVVTGGSAGLGRAIVRELAGRGWDVAVLARGEEGVLAAVKEVQAKGQRALGLSVDVTDHKAVEEAAQQIEDELGPIDLWVNNAMAGVFAEFLEVTPEEYERATAVDYFGFVNGTRAALKRMTKRDRGHVIQVGSALAYRGIPLQAAYCGAKHAIVGMTESIRAELFHSKSRVNISMVHMPALNTIQFNWVRSKLPQHPQPVAPIYQPEVGARAVAHVAEHPRRSTWVGIMTVGTIVGNFFVPGLLDRYLGKTGYDGQQAPDDDNPMLPDNVDRPVDQTEDQGAHGDFDDRAHPRSLQLWLSQRHAAVWSGAAAVAGLGVGTVRKVLRK